MPKPAICLHLLACFLLIPSATGWAQSGSAAKTPANASRPDLYGDPLPPDALARFGTIRFRSGSSFGFAVLSPDGKLVAVNGDADSIRLLDSRTGTIVRKTPVRRPRSMGAAFSPDGKLLATTDSAGKMELHDVVSGALVQSFESKGFPSQMAPVFSANGRVIARVGAHKVSGAECYAWDVASGRLLAKLKVHANLVVGVALSPDGKTLVSWGTHLDFPAGGNGIPGIRPEDSLKSRDTLQLWDLQSAKELRQVELKQGLEGVNGVAFAPDGKSIAVAGNSGGCLLLNPADGTEIRRFGTFAGARSLFNIPGVVQPVNVSFSPDGKKLALAARGVQIWETASGKTLSSQERQADQVFSLVFTGDRVLACGMRAQAVRVWDAVTGEVRGAAGELPTGSIISIAMSPDARKLFTNDSSGRIFTWDVSSGRSVHAEVLAERRQDLLPGALLPLNLIFGMETVLSPHGTYVAYTQQMSRPRLRELAPAREVAELPLKPLPGAFCVAFSRDSSRVIVAGEDFESESGLRALAQRIKPGGLDDATGDVVDLCDSKTGQVLQTFKGLKGMTQAVAVSPDGHLAAAAAVSGGGASAQKGQINVWDGDTGKELAVIKTAPATPSNGEGEPLAFSPDGTMLAVTADPNLICLYEARTGKKIRVLPGNGAFRPGVISFSPDGRVLAVGSGKPVLMFSDQKHASPNVELWEVCSGAVRKEFGGHTGSVTALAFSDDGRLLASGSTDTTALVWDVSGQVLHPLSKGRLNPNEADTLWRELGSENAQQAYGVILRLSSSPEDAVALFRSTLKPAAAAPEATELKRLARQLDSQRFGERETATVRLKDAGKAAVPALLEVLKQSPSTELRHRAEKLIDEITAPALPGGGDIRSTRALEVLEKVNTPEARDLLKTLAEGRPDAWLTLDAKAVLKRLSATR
jgi:WD40 repeat protein